MFRGLRQAIKMILDFGFWIADLLEGNLQSLFVYVAESNLERKNFIFCRQAARFSD